MGQFYQEAIAIGRTFAAMKDYQIDGNKEMVALGAMNVVGSMTSCYVATGEMEAQIKSCEPTYYQMMILVKWWDANKIHV